MLVCWGMMTDDGDRWHGGAFVTDCKAERIRVYTYGMGGCMAYICGVPSESVGGADKG